MLYGTRIKYLFFIIMAMFPVFSIAAAQTAESVLLNAQRADDTLYFLNPQKKRIDPYSLGERKWKSPVSVQRDSATAFHVGADGLSIAFGDMLYRYTLSGGNEEFIGKCSSDVHAIFTDGNLRLAVYQSGIQIYNTVDLSVVLQNFNGWDLRYATGRGCSHHPPTNTLCGFSIGVSPGDIGVMKYDSTGRILSALQSPYHGDYPSGGRSWIFPDGSNVVDDCGIVYTTGELAYVVSLATRITDIDFTGAGVPIAVYQKRVISFSASTLLETGYKQLTITPGKIVVHNDKALLFYIDNNPENGINVDSVALSELSPDPPAQPRDPAGRPFTPDNVFIAGDDLQLLSAKDSSLFRWNLSSQQWRATIPLLGGPNNMAYSRSNNAIYVSYPNCRIYVIHPDSSSPKEIAFTTLASPCLGMVCAGKNLITADPSCDIVHTAFGPDGNRINSIDGNYPMYGPVWSDVNRRIYFFRSTVSPAEFRYEDLKPDGSIIYSSTSIATDTYRTKLPLRLRPDGQFFIVGNGTIFEGKTIAKTNVLPDSIDDAAWINKTLFTLGKKGITRWNPQVYSEAASHAVSGRNHCLLATSGNYLCAVSIDDSGIPAIELFDTLFNGITPGTRVTATILCQAVAPQPRSEHRPLRYYDLQGRLIGTGAAVSGRGFGITGRIAGGIYIVRSASPGKETLQKTFYPAR